jgi:prolyl-tRNA synthetase
MHELDRRLKTKGIKNVQLPLFIKYSEFLKEKEHVEGFAPELFLVTQQGNKKLEEPYVVRPTSEIAFCNYFKKIVSSYSELPIKYNQ